MKLKTKVLYIIANRDLAVYQALDVPMLVNSGNVGPNILSIGV